MAREHTAGETLVYPGGAVKALDDAGRIGGHLVLFGSAEEPDVTSYRDFFTAETDFWMEDAPHKSILLYNHGLDPELGPIRIGDVALKVDDAGVWMEGQIKLRDAYLKKYGKHVEQIHGAVKAGKLGLSSGSASHLVRREKQGNGSHKVLSWPIVEASLTPTPGEPRTAARAIKSLAELKGEYLGADADAQIAFAAIDRAFELCRMKVRYQIGAGSDYYGPMPPPAALRTRAERIAAVKGCLDEMTAAALRAAGMLPEGADGGEGSAAKAITRADDLLSRLGRMHSQ